MLDISPRNYHNDALQQELLATAEILIIAQPNGPVASIAAQIEFYGFRVSRAHLPEVATASLPSATADLLMIEAVPLNGSVIQLFRSGTGLTDKTGVLVIDNGIDPVDRILALEAGADDCVTWPCNVRELVARIRAILRRTQKDGAPAVEASFDGEAPEILTFAGWTIDRPQRRLRRTGLAGSTLPLAEFAVLDQLLRQPRKIVSREALLRSTAPEDAAEVRNLRAIDIQVSRLRKRLEVDGEEIIRTVRGRGYMLLPPVTPA